MNSSPAPAPASMPVRRLFLKPGCPFSQKAAPDFLLWVFFGLGRFLSNLGSDPFVIIFNFDLLQTTKHELKSIFFHHFCCLCNYFPLFCFVNCWTLSLIAGHMFLFFSIYSGGTRLHGFVMGRCHFWILKRVVGISAVLWFKVSQTLLA